MEAAANDTNMGKYKFPQNTDEVHSLRKADNLGKMLMILLLIIIIIDDNSRYKVTFVYYRYV